MKAAFISMFAILVFAGCDSDSKVSDAGEGKKDKNAALQSIYDQLPAHNKSVK